MCTQHDRIQLEKVRIQPRPTTSRIMTSRVFSFHEGDPVSYNEQHLQLYQLRRLEDGLCETMMKRVIELLWLTQQKKTITFFHERIFDALGNNTREPGERVH